MRGTCQQNRLEDMKERDRSGRIGGVWDRCLERDRERFRSRERGEQGVQGKGKAKETIESLLPSLRKKRGRGVMRCRLSDVIEVKRAIKYVLGFASKQFIDIIFWALSGIKSRDIQTNKIREMKLHRYET